ncbi:hypothetical protein Pla22_52530 [Rubripirellula amarantea]|uniref:Uncharacterized protein n=1 Tax=Rubripirellula amarantea TaxID=2527999 RepID=A0A5C5W8X7_9BACT|nr:hypothetical protein Pla22_52530 [Rubripirellula amarantea]
MPIEATLSNAHQFAKSGEHWRSREILRSSLANYSYDRRLLVALVDTCSAMGDRLEAGRWLLTYVDDPTDSQRELIDLFVDRHRAAGYHTLLSQFPVALRPRTLDDSPRFLRSILVQLDAPHTLRSDPCTKGFVASDWVLVIGCAAASIAVGLCALVGLVAIANWVFRQS